MSYFQRALVKTERRTLKVLDGSLPYIEVARKYERKFYQSWFFITAGWLTISAAIIGLSAYLSPVTRGLLWFWWLVSYGYTVNRFFRGYQTKALYQREELRRTRGTIADEKERRQLAEIASRDAQRQAALAAQNEYNRVIYQMRMQLTRRVEDGIKRAVELYREQEADTVWEPNGASAKRIYAQVRENIKAANVPEYGLLRNTTDGEVSFILGDRSFLPPNMTDAQIAERHLPTPVTLPPEAATAKLTGKR